MLVIPPRFNLARACLEMPARRTPDKVALIVVSSADDIANAERWTYGALDLAVRGVAAGLLAEGMRAGERLLLRLANNSDYALMFLGAIAAGIVPVPTSTQLTAEEAAFLLADSAASAIAAGEGLEPSTPARPVRTFSTMDIVQLKATPPLTNYADTAAEDPAYLIYTSGTGSRPKGVVHAHRVLLGREPMRRSWEAITADDVVLHAGAFNWSYTLGVGLLDPWSVGATAMLYTGDKDVKIWPRLIATTGATLFAAVPSLYRQILKYGEIKGSDFQKLRHALAAGEALSRAIRDEWVLRTGTPIYEALGMSECSTFISSGPDVPVRPGSAGKPQPGRKVAILPVDAGTEAAADGELGLLAIHRSEPGLMLGYWQRPDEDRFTSRGDWFVGGDLAAIDADGYVWYRGRADDAMNAGGYRVSPMEVEAALAACPGVAELAVAEFEVKPGVLIIAAHVVRAPGSDVDETRIVNFAAAHLAPYKQPRKVFFVEALPRSANGKLLRRSLPRHS